MLMERAVGEPTRDERGGPAGASSGSLFAIDFHAARAALFRNRYGVLAIFLACIALAIAITLLTTPVFRARSTIQIDQEAAKVLGTEQTELSASIQDTERFLQTQLDVLRSRTVSTAVADELRLFNNPSFLTAMGEDPDGEVPPNLTPAQANRERVLGVLKENMGVTLPRGSRVASIDFNSPDAALAARIANSFADNFIRNNLQRKFDTSAYSREFLNGQLKQAQARLERSEQQALEFAERTRIIDPSSAASPDGAGQSSSPRSLLTATLVRLNAELADATAKRIAASGEWERMSAAPAMSLQEVLANPAIQTLIEERATLRGALQEQLVRRRADYPGVADARARISEIDRQIETLSANIRSTAKSRLDVAAAQEQGIQRRVDQLKGETLDEQREGIQLSILRREADTNRQQFEALLRRVNQLNAESGVQTNNIAVIDRAVEPTEPAWPKVPLNIALALAVAMALSAAYVLVREQLFGKIRTPDDVVDRLQLPVLGAVPNVDGDNVLAEIADQKSHVSEAFHSVRTALTLASKNGLPKTMAFVSTQKGEGKSTICFAMAVGVGRTGKRAVVVDLDLRRPNQHRLFGVKNDGGVSSVLTGNAALDAAVQRTAFGNVDLLTAGPIPPNPTELLTSDMLHELIHRLGERYDVVLIDSPPVLGLADAIIIGSIVDNLVFVTQSGRNNPKGVQSAIRRLRQGNANVLGVVLSRFDPETSGYAADYVYQYSYGH